MSVYTDTERPLILFTLLVLINEPIGDVALGGNELQEGEGHYNDKWKPTGFDTKKIFLSPSIKYSGCPVYAKKQRYMITFPYNLYIMHVQFIIMPLIHSL